MIKDLDVETPCTQLTLFEVYKLALKSEQWALHAYFGHETEITSGSATGDVTHVTDVAVKRPISYFV